MPKIVPIVEGEGEVEAVPILLRKILEEMRRWDIQIARPKNSNGCENLKKPNGLERFVRLAEMEPDCAAILVLMDADEQCPKNLAMSFAARVRAVGVRYPTAIVLPKCEYEAWFLASLKSIAGKELKGRSGLPEGLAYVSDIEGLRGVKGWLSRQLPEGRIYKETLDQAPMTHLIDLQEARASRSFRRLFHAVEQLVEAVDNNKVIVTPE